MTLSCHSPTFRYGIQLVSRCGQSIPWMQVFPIGFALNHPHLSGHLADSILSCFLMGLHQDEDSKVWFNLQLWCSWTLTLFSRFWSCPSPVDPPPCLAYQRVSHLCGTVRRCSTAEPPWQYCACTLPRSSNRDVRHEEVFSVQWHPHGRYHSSFANAGCCPIDPKVWAPGRSETNLSQQPGIQHRILLE